MTNTKTNLKNLTTLKSKLQQEQQDYINKIIQMTKDKQGSTNLFLQLIHAEFVGFSSFFDKSLCQECIDLHMKIDESLDNLGDGHELSLQFHPFRLKN